MKLQILCALCVLVMAHLWIKFLMNKSLWRTMTILFLLRQFPTLFCYPLRSTSPRQEVGEKGENRRLSDYYLDENKIFSQSVERNVLQRDLIPCSSARACLLLTDASRRNVDLLLFFSLENVFGKVFCSVEFVKALIMMTVCINLSGVNAQHYMKRNTSTCQSFEK